MYGIRLAQCFLYLSPVESNIQQETDYNVLDLQVIKGCRVFQGSRETDEAY
jgi:hypothetical protein